MNREIYNRMFIDNKDSLAIRAIKAIVSDVIL